MIFNTVCNNIRNELNDQTAATLARIVRWVNEAHKKICGIRKWPFLVIEESDQMSIAAAAVPYSSATITFDTGIAHETNWAIDDILNVWDVTDSVQPLEMITTDRLRQQLQTTLTEAGQPLYWYYAKQVRADSAVPQRYVGFYPTLDATRTFVFAFTRKPTTLPSGSVAVMLIPDEWEHVMFEYVMSKAWRQRGDDRWVDSRQAYEDGLEEMKAKCASRLITGFNPAGGAVMSRFPQIVTQP